MVPSHRRCAQYSHSAQQTLGTRTRGLPLLRPTNGYCFYDCAVCDDDTDECGKMAAAMRLHEPPRPLRRTTRRFVTRSLSFSRVAFSLSGVSCVECRPEIVKVNDNGRRHSRKTDLAALV